MNNDVIERIAQAAWEMGPGELAEGQTIPPWADLLGYEQWQAATFVRNVLRAVREPSEAMIVAGVIANQERMVGAVWQAMIDALLSDQPHSPEQQR